MDSQWLGFLVTVGLGLAVYYFFFRCRDLESEECSPKKDKMSKWRIDIDPCSEDRHEVSNRKKIHRHTIPREVTSYTPSSLSNLSAPSDPSLPCFFNADGTRKEMGLGGSSGGGGSSREWEEHSSRQSDVKQNSYDYNNRYYSPDSVLHESTSHYHSHDSCDSGSSSYDSGSSSSSSDSGSCSCD